MHVNRGYADIRAIMFDCDGVLVDSEYAHYLSWQNAMQLQGGDLTLEDYCAYVGNSGPVNAQLFAQKINFEEPHRLLEDKRAYYHKHLLEQIPGIEANVKLLRSLAEEKTRLGLKIGVCSAAKKKEILSHLTRLGIVDLCDIILSGQDDLMEYKDPEGVNKPKPYIYLHAAKQLGLLPEQCVVLEDSVPGVTAGVTAGCLTIAVPNAYTDKHDFSHAHLQLDSTTLQGPDHFLSIVHDALLFKEGGGIKNDE